LTLSAGTFGALAQEDFPMARPVALLVVALSLGLAPAPFLARKASPAETDLKALQGVWVPVNETEGGQPSKDTRPREEAYTGDRLVINFFGKGPEARWRVALDPAKSPKWMDLMNGTRVVVRCAYRLQGGTLTVWYRNDGIRPGARTGAEGVVWAAFRRKGP
jgi:uncharacterized protein (TIGR03067 family)